MTPTGSCTISATSCCTCSAPKRASFTIWNISGPTRHASTGSPSSNKPNDHGSHISQSGQRSMNVLEELRSRFLAALQGLADDPAPLAALVKPVQDPKFGDYQANCAMPLAKLRGLAPRELAAQVVERLQVADLCEPPEIAGPGFINLKLKHEWLVQHINRIVVDPRLGVVAVSRPRRIVIDYSSPNVAKPMHVGHLRSTVIGDALYRILRFAGHQVTSDNHIGDWGTQFGMIIYGYKHFLCAQTFETNVVAELARLYRLVNQLCDYHDAVSGLPNLEKILAEARATRLQTEATAAQADKKDQDTIKKTLKRQALAIEGICQEISSARKKIEAVDESPELKALAHAYPRIAVAAREETAKLHAGDAENLALWKQFMPACLAAINAMYARLGVRFDMALGESFYQPLLAQVVESLQARGIATESDGAICVFIPGI